MNLREAVLFVNDNFNDEARDQFSNVNRTDLAVFHHGFGTWIRNNCGLWDHGGTEAIVADLRELIRNGYHLDEITDGQWTLENESSTEMCDNRVAHPDQTSTIVMYVLHDWLNGILRHHDFKPMRYRRIDRIL